MGLIAAGVGAAAMIGGAAMSAGKKVKVPQFQKVDVEGEQRKAIQNNLANFDQASQLAAKTTSADQAVLTEQLRKAIPGYDQIISKASQNIQSQLGGEINPDVSAQVQRSSAARALAGGYGASSGLGRSLTARDLGLTSMGIQQQGFGNALNFIQSQRRAATVNPMSVSSMFISPSQRLNIALQENQNMFQRDLMAAQVAAQPDPMMAAIGGSLSNMGGMVFGGAMGGGGMGGGKGGGGMSSMFSSFRPVFGSVGRYAPSYSSPDWTASMETGGYGGIGTGE